MSGDIRNLEPKAVWNHFADLNEVPRASKKEEQVIAFAKQFAEKNNLDYDVDAVGNVVIRKPATSGMENRRAVILQAHLDMVHQKNADTDFDFATQGIVSLIDGDWVTADGTTLGADNGMGVAAAMAVLESTDIAHPELEVLFTIDEETGMTGAHNLKSDFLKGEILMNLDTEDDDELSIGCAGGIDTTVNWNYAEEPTPTSMTSLVLKVRGLKGGHSGMDIVFGRGNANKIMNRLLWDTYENYGLRVSSIDGGGLRNAIPRESTCVLVVPSINEVAVKAHWDTLIKELESEFATTDPHIEISYEASGLPSNVMKAEDQQKIIWAIQCCHNGIRRLSPDVADLVETSNNVAKVALKNGQCHITTLQRSDRESAKMDMAHSIAAPFKLIGAQVETSGSYPGWKLDPNAPMLQMMKDLYVEMYKEQPRVIACHAGLECGLIGEHFPDLEMISFGPTIQHPHSPDERVNIASVGKFWNYLQEALKRIPAKAQ